MGDDEDNDETELDPASNDKTASNENGVDRGRGIATDGGRNEGSPGRNLNRGMRGQDRNSRFKPGARNAAGKAGAAASGVGSIVSKIAGYIPIKGIFIFSGIFLGIGVLGIGLASGTGYSGLINEIGGSAASNLGSGISDVAGEAQYQLSQVVSKILCITKGAGCFRELMLNRTSQPGSQDIGETYRLKVQNLEIVASRDMRFKKPTEPIPITFRVKNTRHGLKGIKARDVEYKVQIREPSLLGSGEVACETDFLDLNRFKGSKRNTLYPGESATPLNYKGNKRLTLEECGLLNPVSSTVEAILQIKYKYSANSFLNLNVKASDNVKSINPEKRSKTPNTPVETVIKAPNPVQFINNNNQRKPIPFLVRTTFSTDKDNIKYRVDASEFKLKDSNLTKRANANCKDLKKVSADTYRLSNDDKFNKYYNKKKGPGWLDYRTPAPNALCRFTIARSKIDEISPTGETITFSASANYTVKQEERRSSFTLTNTMCRIYNCPVLTPIDGSNFQQVKDINLRQDKPTNTPNYWELEYSFCNRPQDGQNGCSVVESFELPQRNQPLDINGNYVQNSDQRAFQVAERAFVLKISQGLYNEGKSNNLISCYANDKRISGSYERLIDVSKRNWNRILKEEYTMNFTQGEWVVDKIKNEPKPGKCKRSSSSQKKSP